MLFQPPSLSYIARGLKTWEGRVCRGRWAELALSIESGARPVFVGMQGELLCRYWMVGVRRFFGPRAFAAAYQAAATADRVGNALLPWVDGPEQALDTYSSFLRPGEVLSDITARCGAV